MNSCGNHFHDGESLARLLSIHIKIHSLFAPIPRNGGAEWKKLRLQVRPFVATRSSCQIPKSFTRTRNLTVTTYEGARESVAFVERYIRKNGPYDGGEFEYTRERKCDRTTGEEWAEQARRREFLSIQPNHACNFIFIAMLSLAPASVLGFSQGGALAATLCMRSVPVARTFLGDDRMSGHACIQT